MEIKIGTGQLLKLLAVIAWIIFVGLCIQAGGLICNTVFTFVLTPAAAKHLWQEVDLSNLYKSDSAHFLTLSSIICIAAVMKAILFYLIIKLLHKKELSLSRPFNTTVRNFILHVSYLSSGIGLFSFWGQNYAAWLGKQGAVLPNAEKLLIGGADVWLFMSVTIFVIAQVFKRGIEIQTENELTV